LVKHPAMNYYSFRWVKKFDYQKAVSVLLTVLLLFQIISGVFLFVPPPKQAQAATETWTTNNNFDSNLILIDSQASYLNPVPFSTPITNYNNNIYTCYINASMETIVAKSTDNGVTWTTTTIATGTADDAHNICSIGIDDDGYIHVAYDMHCSALKYKVSVNPEDISEFRAGTMTGTAENSVTYPQFYKSPTGELYFLYRNGYSTNGDLYIKKYATSTQTWSDFAAPLLQGSTVTPTNNAYWDTLVWDSQGDMHLSWVIRESGGTLNYNILYAKYDTSDGQWEKTDGTPYTLPITATSSPGVEVVAEIPDGTGLSNQNSLYVDSLDRPHIAYLKDAADGLTEVWHTYYNGTSWVTTQVTDLNPTATAAVWDLSRPMILIDSDDTIYIFFADAGASTASNYASPAGTFYWTKSTDYGATWTSPTTVDVPLGDEFVYDHLYFRDTGNIRFFYQETTNPSSPLYILEGDKILQALADTATYTNIDTDQAKLGTLQLKNNFVGYWKLEETSGDTLDSTINNLDGTIYGTGITRGVTGHSGLAYQFDGTSSVKIPNNSLLNFGTDTDFTIEAWFKTSVDGYIVSKYSGGETPGFALYVYNGKVKAWLRDGTGSADYTNITGTTTVTDNAWHHVAAVFDRDGNLSLYLDGSSDATPVSITVNDTISNSSNLVIGGRDDNSGFFKGIIDEVAIFSRALSTSEFNYSQDYSSPFINYSSGSYTSPFHTWTANKIYNNLIVDATLNSGTITATAQASTDKFSTIDATYEISISDGNNTYPLPLTSNGQYARVVFDLTPGNSSSTPVINSFQMTANPLNNSIYFNSSTPITNTVSSSGSINWNRAVTRNDTELTNMTVTPSAGSIDITIDTWNTSGTYYKKWTESATGTLSVEHTVGDLKPNTYYTVKVDGTIYNTFLSNSSGEISFTYTGEYSDHDFEVEEDTTPPTPFNLSSPADNSCTNDSTPLFSWNASSDSESGLAKYQLFINNTLNKDNINPLTTSVEPAEVLSNGYYTWYIRAFDNAGNYTDSNAFNLRIPCGGFALPPVDFQPLTPPEEGFSVLINNGAEYTTEREVTLKLNGGPDAERMSISEDPEFTEAVQESYQPTKIWTLSESEGKKIIYVKFYTQWGRSSPIVSDSIILIEEKPIEEMTASSSTSSPKMIFSFCRLLCKSATFTKIL